MILRANLALIGLAGAVSAFVGPALAQDGKSQSSEVGQIGAQVDREPSKTEALQIDDVQTDRAYWPDELQVSQNRIVEPVVGARQDQASAPDRSNEAPQISTAEESERAIAQLNLGDLEGTLAQLSSAERQVLLDAIEGTDICDNPPEIEAIIELCQSRIETRAREFAASEANTLSPEERLLGESLDKTVNVSTLERSVERLARNAGRGDANSLDTQAIASVALGTPQPALPEQPGGTELGDLPAETQALINALVQQLGGAAGGPPQ